jgi:beta-galactosidase
MNPIAFDTLSYLIDGHPVFLYSGEFHYFRVPKKDWRPRMELLKGAGGNCLATYVPWLIHEPAEGQFVFSGDDGRLDLEEFLQTATDAGLYVIARPGPYQYSELIFAGLPKWLLENYSEIHAQNLEGQNYGPFSVSYVHPLFLEKVRAWFGRVCPILAKHTVTRGGPIAFTQIDNELVGIHEWFGGIDYNPTAMGFGTPEGRYPLFLKQKFQTVSALNQAYETLFSSFQEARPLPAGDSAKPADIRRRKDYFDFYLSTIAEYSAVLAGMMREFGIDTPLVHNSANPNMNTYFTETINALSNRHDFILGSDHYYNLNQEWRQNNPTPQFAIGVYWSLETLRLMGFPPTIFELASGSLSDWPPITPQDEKAYYWMHLALGMKGSNFYIFTGGVNPPGAGITSDIYDYSAPIGPFGEIRPLYDVQKEIGTFLTERPWFARTRLEYDFRCLLDFECARSGNYWKQKGETLVRSSEASDFLQKGILTTAFCAGLSPALRNLDSDDWINDTDTPLVAVCSSSMSAAKQKRIVEFLERGGKLLLMPVFPTLDENLYPCTILADYLHQPVLKSARTGCVRVDVAGVSNIFNNGEVFLTENFPPRAAVIGTEGFSGKPLAWSLDAPCHGKIIFLGFRWVHAMREHEMMLRNLLAPLGLKPKVTCSNPNIWCVLRTADRHSILFVMNLFTAPMETQVTCRPAWSDKPIDIGRHTLEPMSVKIIEVE